MSKILKKFMATTMAAALAMNSIIHMPANAETTYSWATSSSWALHTDPHDSKVSDMLLLVADGNGYYAYITSKSGNCSVNYVTISEKYTDTKTITEQGKSFKIFMKPRKFTKDYVVFTVDLIAREGTQSYNGGTIERI